MYEQESQHIVAIVNLHTLLSLSFVGKEMPISKIVIAVPNATVVLLE
jgi:hypothetical protein